MSTTNNNSSPNQHKNSRKITIFRSNNFVISAQSGEAVMDFVGLSSKSVGPYWESHSARIIGSGLTLEEQDILMPVMLSMSVEDREYRRSIFNFFNNLTTKIPPNSGRDLEIGLLGSNDKPLSDTNMPISVSDYIRYRHAKNHPWVAESQTESKGNQLKFFYIHDAETQLKEDSDKMVIQDQADEIYLSIKNNDSKVSQLLVMLGKDPRDFAGAKAPQLRLRELRTIVDTQASLFLEKYQTDRFEIRYWLKAMETAGTIRVVGTSYVITENNKLLGRSLEEAVLYMEDPANTDTVSFLKAAAQEVLAKPRKGKTTKTVLR